VRPSFSLLMHLAIIGDWVAWKPEIAPQATVMNIYGHTGVPSGCRFYRDISGMVYLPPDNSMPPITDAAITISSMPRTG